MSLVHLNDFNSCLSSPRTPEDCFKLASLFVQWYSMVFGSVDGASNEM